MIYMTLGAETERKVVHEQAGCSKWRLEPGDHAYLSGFHFDNSGLAALHSLDAERCLFVKFILYQ